MNAEKSLAQLPEILALAHESMTFFEEGSRMHARAQQLIARTPQTEEALRPWNEDIQDLMMHLDFQHQRGANLMKRHEQLTITHTEHD